MPKHVPGTFGANCTMKEIKFTVDREQWVNSYGYIGGYRNSDIERGLSKYMLPKAIETWS